MLNIRIHHVFDDPHMLALVNQGRIIMATLDVISAAVAANKTMTDNAVALLVSLKAKVDAGAAVTPDEVQAVADALTANTNELGTAITANTPPSA